MNVKLITAITAGVMTAGTAVPVLAIPVTLPIDYRSGGVPAGSSATGIGGGSVTQNSEGLGVNSAGFAIFDDNGEVGPGETLTVPVNATVTGVWLLQLFEEGTPLGPVIEAGSVELFDANGSLGVFTFDGTGNPPKPASNGERFVDFGGAFAVTSATFNGGPGEFFPDQVLNEDFSVAGFTTAAPDGGSNLLLLSSAFSALGLMRRKW
jgi:hypothetical protein